MHLAYWKHKWHLNAHVSTSSFTPGRYPLSILSTIKYNIHKSQLQQNIKERAKTLRKYKDKNGLSNF